MVLVEVTMADIVEVDLAEAVASEEVLVVAEVASVVEVLQADGNFVIMKMKFNDTEKKEIEEAVKALEKESSGELVLYYTAQSDDYDEVSWMTATVLGVLGIVTVMIAAYYWLLPPGYSMIEIGIYLIVLMAIGFFIPKFWKPLKRFFANDAKKDHRVFTKANDAFLAEEVFKTIDRTGILIFISELEQRVVVLADSGINAKVDHSDWQHVVDQIITGIKTNKLKDGLIDAVNSCKKLLLDNGFVVRPDDTNELSDEIRIG